MVPNHPRDGVPHKIGFGLTRLRTARVAQQPGKARDGVQTGLGSGPAGQDVIRKRKRLGLQHP
jgi:hypothetical protein